ncbi:Phospholipase DDHD1 [Varanus komodoensis]|nr:Phospholipase DDHD1 [Varanus komodoensis]
MGSRFLCSGRGEQSFLLGFLTSEAMLESFANSSDAPSQNFTLKVVVYHLPPFSLHSLFKWRGYKESSEAAGLKRKWSEAIHSLKLSRNHVDWHSVDEVYLYSDATTSKIARTVSQKLGFSKASSSGTRLHRGYVEEATLEDKPSPTTHIVFVVHGIGQKMDQGRIIRNTAMLRETARKIEDKYFCNLATHVEFLPVEWRSKLALDGDTVDSITPDKVRGLRDMLNSSAMDIMYYTSPLYRDELVKGLQQEMNRLYTLFCSRNPEFTEKGGKASIVSHSLGCVITYDIMTGWNPVRLYEQLLEKEYDDLQDTWMSFEEQSLLEEFYITKQRLKEIEENLHGLKSSTISKTPALKFKVRMCRKSASGTGSVLAGRRLQLFSRFHLDKHPQLPPLRSGLAKKQLLSERVRKSSPAAREQVGRSVKKLSGGPSSEVRPSGSHGEVRVAALVAREVSFSGGAEAAGTSRTWLKVDPLDFPVSHDQQMVCCGSPQRVRVVSPPPPPALLTGHSREVEYPQIATLQLFLRFVVLPMLVENFFCMGSPLAVFLALRGIRPGNSGSQDHILPRTICNRLLNIFHPTDPVVSVSAVTSFHLAEAALP